MIGIKVNGLFLELKPGTAAEIERKSPFFAIDEVAAEYTTPLSFRYTENNAIALGFIYQYYTKRLKKKVAVEIYDGTSFKYKATLVVETGKMNMNRLEDSELSGYLLFGISDFFQAVKGKKLSELQLGGLRTFTWTTKLPFDGSNGFWQHIHRTWIDDTIPYVFVPIRNEHYAGENGDVDWMNKLDITSTTANKIWYDFNNPLVPQIRLPYLLQKIFEEAGFEVDFTGLNDADWRRLLLVNLTGVNWLTTTQTAAGIGPAPSATITIDLKKHLPQDKTVSDFLVQLFGRYCWAPLFDVVQRKVRLVAGKELFKGGRRKDWTMYAEPVFDSSFNQDKKIFAFTNEIDGNDQLPSAPDFTGARFSASVINFQQLPINPGPELKGRIAYVYLENQWYQVQLDETTNKYAWKLFADNIYNEEPKNATDTISTTISTLPYYFTRYRKPNATANEYLYGFFPMLNQEATTPIGYRTLLYHGMTNETRDNGGAWLLKYPLASSTRNNTTGLTPLTWSNVYRHKYFAGSVFEVDYGIISYWWKDFLNILKHGEECVFKVWLELNELTSFAWDEEILIENIPYLVTQITEPMPYRGFVQATLKRLLPEEPEVVAVDADNNVVSGVFARLSVFNTRNKVNGSLTHRICDVKVNLYGDAAGTIAFKPPSVLYVLVRQANLHNDNSVTTTEDYLGVDSNERVILSGVDYDVYASGVLIKKMTYTLQPSAARDYVVM